ncbi:hypothetical protein Nepgr_002631 [Nepenthes gracilis]|uniref:Uncharacterized protein n=1 Tax=Nepenthes gracilis TaxID=150966 RepID=A0AAD3P7E4_NEPGR|nr:hypothetical protein Nepgr_002631 [Nepenthes gracilis]
MTSRHELPNSPDAEPASACGNYPEKQAENEGVGSRHHVILGNRTKGRGNRFRETPYRPGGLRVPLLHNGGPLHHYSHKVPRHPSGGKMVEWEKPESIFHEPRMRATILIRSRGKAIRPMAWLLQPRTG